MEYITYKESEVEHLNRRNIRDNPEYIPEWLKGSD